MLRSTCFWPSLDEESSKMCHQTSSQVLWQLRKIALTNLSYSAFNCGIHLIAIWLEKVKLVFPKKTKQDWHKSILLREGKYNSFFITITIQSSCEKFSGFFFSYIFFFASPSKRLFLMLPTFQRNKFEHASSTRSSFPSSSSATLFRLAVANSTKSASIIFSMTRSSSANCEPKCLQENKAFTDKLQVQVHPSPHTKQKSYF